MKPYENEIITINMPADNHNEHLHCGYHPYIVIKNYGENCLVIPCTSITHKRNLPTHVFLQTKWNKDTVAMVEQVTTIKTEMVQNGKYKATLCQEDILNIWAALTVQLGLNDNPFHSKSKGSVVSLDNMQSYPADANANMESRFLLVSNDMCNKHSPVVNVIPISEERQSATDKRVYSISGKVGYADFKNIMLVSKKQLKVHAVGENIKPSSVYAVNRCIEKLFFQPKNEQIKVACP